MASFYHHFDVKEGETATAHVDGAGARRCRVRDGRGAGVAGEAAGDFGQRCARDRGAVYRAVRRRLAVCVGQQAFGHATVGGVVESVRGGLAPLSNPSRAGERLTRESPACGLPST